LSAERGKKAVENLSKVVDNRYKMQCVVGFGELREKVWVDGSGEAVRYNLAFVNCYLFSRDNGRILGYDTAHGRLHRHFCGNTEEIASASYGEILERFISEVGELRKKKELSTTTG
jgi:hypothetical protein